MKNLIFDIGGIFIDDGYENLAKVLEVSVEEAHELYRFLFKNGFKDCILGRKNINELVYEVVEKDKENAEKYRFMLNSNNYKEVIPLFQENFDKILALKDKGYRIYLLSNITEDTYKYLEETVNLFNLVDGGVYSYQVQLAKPDKEIFKLILDKYNLDIKECIFFDDREKNVIASNDFGLKAVCFKKLEDLYNVINT